MRSLLFPRRPAADALAAAYDRAARTWHRTISRIGFVDAYGELLDSLGRPSFAGKSVLDAGCGTAAFSLAFGRRYPRASFDLLDVSEGMLDIATQNLAAEGLSGAGICCDVHDLAVRAKRYDVVLSAHLIEHCERPDHVLKALFDALRPGGSLIMVVSKPHWCTALVRMRWGHRAFRPREVESLLLNAGLRDIETHSFSAGPPKRLSAGYIAHKPEE